jgi:hypothetical protein
MRRARSRRPRLLFSSMLAMLALLAMLSGCAAGYSPTATEDQHEVDRIALGAARVHQGREESDGAIGGSSKALEAELFLSDAGKVVAQAMRAHGGWDSWTRLARVSYVRDRITTDERGQPLTGQQPQDTPFEVAIDSTGRLVDGSSSEMGDEHFLLSLPFGLADRNVAKEYAGVEEDAKTGELFERIRCARGGFGGDWSLLYFDRSTMVLKRKLDQRDGKFTMTLFSTWKDVGGVKLATKRSSYRLASRYDHRDAGRPDWIDVLTDLHPGN